MTEKRIQAASNIMYPGCPKLGIIIGAAAVPWPPGSSLLIEANEKNQGEGQKSGDDKREGEALPKAKDHNGHQGPKPDVLVLVVHVSISLKKCYQAV